MGKKVKKKKATKKSPTQELSLKNLLEAGCHFGHQARRWHPKMKPYLYSAREGIHIFDLAKTRDGLKVALDFVKKLAAKGGTIVFVGTKRQAKAIIKEEAQKAGMPYVAERWLGGTITNWGQIKKSIDKLKDLKVKREAGELKKYTKKEQILIDRQIARLEKFFGGLANLEKLPEAIFVVDIKREEAVIKEARQENIPVIAIVDSNANPDQVDYVIPANDDAVGPIKLIVEMIGGAAKEGREIWGKKSSKSAS